MNAPTAAPEFTVVTTCYWEERSIREFHARLSATLQELGRSYEIVFVNDGSGDGTLDCLEAIFEQDEHVYMVIDLMKNVGQTVAITAGCAHARGHNIILLDSDLQLDPEDLPGLIAEFDKGFDLVTGYRVARQDSRLRTIPSRLANVIMRMMSNTDLRDFGCTFKILDGRLIRAFQPGPNRPLKPPHVIAAAGRITEVPVSHHPRPYGRSGWSFSRLFAYNMENLVNLSQRPFQILSAACFLVGLLLVLRVLASLVVSAPLLSTVTNGLILNVLVFCLLIIVGVLCAVGEYVIRGYLILQGHPAYIIRGVRTR
ncbi:MAG: glycosyltransferase family 2 protein [bacterium]|nr:glycosyltransferase family 2 protein [bacterium]